MRFDIIFINEAYNGNRKSALSLINTARNLIKTNEPLPKDLRDYFINCFDKILQDGLSCDANKAFNLTRGKKSKRKEDDDNNYGNILQKIDGYRFDWHSPKRGRKMSLEKAIYQYIDDESPKINFDMIKKYYMKQKKEHEAERAAESKFLREELGDDYLG